MNTISLKRASELLGHPPDIVERYSYLATSGTAEIPLRFWKYEALTTTEYNSLRTTDNRWIRRIAA